MLTPKRIGCFLAAIIIVAGAVCGVCANFAFNNAVTGIAAIITAIACLPTAKRLMNKALEG